MSETTKSKSFYSEIIPYCAGMFPADIKVKRDKLIGNIHRSILGLTKTKELRPIEDLAFFMSFCQQYKLNPFRKEVYATYVWNSTTNREELTPIVSIHGLRDLARRAKNPTYCYTGGAKLEFDPDGKTLISATVETYGRFGAGEVQKISEYTAYYDEFVRVKKDGDPTATWKKMPRVMLTKCAEANAIRMGFGISGIYIEDELPTNEMAVETAASDTVLEGEVCE
jgi:phage recombination protein Bet